MSLVKLRKQLKAEQLRQKTVIGNAVKNLRTGCNLTQAELAEELGMTRARLNNIENKGSLITVTNLVDICVYFNVSADEILGLKGRT